uniref:Vanin 3 n=1 Tax=Pipistrellus kuhlii TaxID=59472 RepID=A0A7J7YPL3_PIPKU|nr:vanin 3 [Pipistrellus kuhlii]
MITSYFPKYVALFALLVLSVGALDTFIAAVYEHAVILPNRTETPASKEEAVLLMNKNIDVLEKAVKLAATQGAHIIVTPEDGIYGWVFTRETIYPYLEDIPHPEVNWIPCTDPQSLVQHAAPPLGCSLPLGLGQGHGCQPACSQHPQHQHAHDRKWNLRSGSSQGVSL